MGDMKGMTNKVDEQLEVLRQRLSTIEKTGNTINLYHGEGTGSSSVELTRTSKGLNYSVKVYSNDLTGANTALTVALEMQVRLDHQIKNFDGIDG